MENKPISQVFEAITKAQDIMEAKIPMTESNRIALNKLYEAEMWLLKGDE